MKKIGITCYPTVGGSGVIATELGMLLAEQGNEIHFITSSLPFRLNQIYPKIYFHEVELNHYPVFQHPPYDLALASKMAEVIDREKLDILHVHYAMPHAISAILARDIAEHDVKIVTTLHGTDITVLGIDHTFKKMIKYGIEQSDAVTAVSKSLVNQTKDRLEVNKDISVIYNFVNEQEYFKKEMPFIKQQYGINPDEKVIIHISNFRKVKRTEDVIQTFYMINKQINSKLLLVGDGPDYSAANELVNKLGIANRVLFLGKQKNISDLLSIADLKLLLSEKESFGLVLLEAMACEVPCIGTNVGGIPEVITHNETGYIVELGDRNKAAKYAVHLLSDADLLRKFSRNALAHAENYFHSEKIVNQYSTLYDKVLMNQN
ncbi:N-acetyl-alpha-D-glucosaminyl L-malate synthase BshA [Virgibacillus natechei]|uniref:N-acetyl-alpha-D-glucosaminyl L-malate synthase BshA n=1 Tax=Virgibacillus natechei TaxID=1216297 RepID=A0ABS4IG82_9BACI|nr:N-acetyl-alpha-D-glucosaminyl L-malate synthase BshA [Virgibacillus natechei]MBP1969590.1 N-acetyl-alpha-D-glucosaminyl L-malate synthase BshA [Virgibacillus natechei]UZD14818.1 N-acetyl-alpha-D-glucosaminyl L-malate synthase BshA [Virgibacillus natechei]